MEKGRVVIIGGTPRSGKTTVARKLAKSGFNFISFDHIMQAIKIGLPEVNIEDWLNQEACAAKLYPFFESLIKQYAEDAKVYGLSFVVEIHSFYPAYVRKLPCQDEIKVCFLGYPSQSAAQIKHNIVTYAEPTDWIAQFASDDDLLNVLSNKYFIENQMHAAQCAEYGYSFFDTGAGEERGLILQKTLKCLSVETYES